MLLCKAGREDANSTKIVETLKDGEFVIGFAESLKVKGDDGKNLQTLLTTELKFLIGNFEFN